MIMMVNNYIYLSPVEVHTLRLVLYNICSTGKLLLKLLILVFRRVRLNNSEYLIKHCKLKTKKK